MHSYNQPLLPVVGQSGVESFASDWIPVGAGGYRTASVSISRAAAAATAGVLAFEGTDDPSFDAAAVIDVTKVHGAPLAATADAGKTLVVISNCPGWIRLKYTRSGGGAAAQFRAYVTLTQ